MRPARTSLDELSRISTMRIPVLDVTPVVEHGAHPAKAVVGEAFEVGAVVFREGHDAFAAEVVLTAPDGVDRAPVRMHTSPTGEVSRMVATVAADLPGSWTFAVHSWSDPWGTWRHDTGIKVRAGVDVELMFAEGVALLRRWSTEVTAPAADRSVVADAIAAFADTARPVEARLAVAETPELDAAMRAHPLRDLQSSTAPYPLEVDRERALFSAWYELFPRSTGARLVPGGDGDTVVPGTFRTAAERLPEVAAMGFDVVYLPPIHPIGEVNRKGRNNTLDPGPEDVGSPWAIGSRFGGHDTVHPDLGTIDDFDAFVAAAAEAGLEVALDFALQAAPDHPWVQTHPEWFTTRVDGSIAYAENPPKKYQDIYPINFDNDPAGIYAEAERVLRFWMSHGVRIFRVDNPHTKPLGFWEWLLGRIRETDPDVLFLSEAFTTPPRMRGLAAIGFHQSYTYFTWRNTREEIESYFTEVAHETAHVLRPNFWVNTPDILHEYLQYGGPAAFKIRAVLAATGSPSWGVYSGFELYEHVALRPGSEEYLDSEKYQVRVRDWQGAIERGQSLAPYLTKLNGIRRAHPALQQLRDLSVQPTDDGQVVCFAKQARDSQGVTDTVIVVVNVDPHHTHETMVHLDLQALGLPDSFDVHDEITDQTWRWGRDAYVRLDPASEPAHVLTVRV